MDFFYINSVDFRKKIQISRISINWWQLIIISLNENCDILTILNNFNLIKFERRIYFFYSNFSTVRWILPSKMSLRIWKYFDKGDCGGITLDMEVLWYRVHRKILPLAYTWNAEIITSTYKLCHNNYDRTFPLKIIYDSYYVLWIWFLPLIHDYIQFVLCTTNLIFSINSWFFFHTYTIFLKRRIKINFDEEWKE